MTLLTVWRDDEPETPDLRTADAEEIAVVLKELGVRFEQWPLQELSDDVTQDEALDAYAEQIDAVTAAEGYVLVDAMQMTPRRPGVAGDRAGQPGEVPRRAHARRRRGPLLRLAAPASSTCTSRGKVHAVLCEAGDLLTVPGGTTHWFDMGTNPDYVSIRFFHDDDGWVGNFTGSEHLPVVPDLRPARRRPLRFLGPQL